MINKIAPIKAINVPYPIEVVSPMTTNQLDMNDRAPYQKNVMSNERIPHRIVNKPFDRRAKTRPRMPMTRTIVPNPVSSPITSVEITPEPGTLTQGNTVAKIVNIPPTTPMINPIVISGFVIFMLILLSHPGKVTCVFISYDLI